MKQYNNEAMKVYDFQIIANLLSGNGAAEQALKRLKVFLNKNNLTYRSLEITKPTPISQIPEDGQTHIKKGVICLGGDGTVSETVGYVLNNRIDKPIAIIPTGTANIIASTLKLNTKASSFDYLTQGTTRHVDIGVADYGQEKDYFILGLGLGFEENFLRLTKEKLKKKMGVFSYILAALSELLSLKTIPVTIKTQDKDYKLQVCLLAVLNLQPSILKLFPLFRNGEIKRDDGMFNIYYVEYKNYFQALAGTLAFHIFGRKNLGLVKSLCAKAFTLESPGICRTQVDGEPRSCLPVNISFHHKPCYFISSE